MSSDKNKTIEEGVIDTFRSGRRLDTSTIARTDWRFIYFTHLYFYMKVLQQKSEDQYDMESLWCVLRS